MRVFVTGASGWIGSAVVHELTESGHSVVGLARSSPAASRLEAAGVHVVEGTLDDLDVLSRAAESCDGVIHLAFKHDVAFSGDFLGAADADRLAIETFADALAGSGRPLVIASGVLGLAPGRVATEGDGVDAGYQVDQFGSGPSLRYNNALMTLSLAQRDVRSCVLRLPPTVHGDGDNGFVAALVGIARTTGVSGYVGDGMNRWPAVHRNDAARLFRMALEKAPAGTALHAVGDEGVAIRDVADVIGRHLDVPVVGVAPDVAAEHFSWLSQFIALDSPASSELTRRSMAWEPKNLGLIADLELGHYFSS